MASTFPTTTDSFTSLTAHVTRGAASDITALQLAMVAVQNSLTGVAGAGVKTYIPFYSQRSANKQFAIKMGGSSFAGGPDGASTFDDVLAIGYNIGSASVIADTAQPYFAETWEASYWNGSAMIMERNFSFTNTVAKSSYTVRPSEFAIDQTNSVSLSTAVHSWQFRIGHAAGSFFRIGNPNIRDDLFEFTPAGSFKIGYDATHGVSITPSKTGSDTVMTFSMTAGEGAPYAVFTHGISLGGVGSVGAYDLKAGGSIFVTGTATAGAVVSDTLTLTNTGYAVTLANGSRIKAAGTGANGWWITNPQSSTNATVSGTPVTVKVDMNGTNYYFLVYPTSSA